MSWRKFTSVTNFKQKRKVDHNKGIIHGDLNIKGNLIVENQTNTESIFYNRKINNKYLFKPLKKRIQIKTLNKGDKFKAKSKRTFEFTLDKDINEMIIKNFALIYLYSYVSLSSEFNYNNNGVYKLSNDNFLFGKIYKKQSDKFISDIGNKTSYSLPKIYINKNNNKIRFFENNYNEYDNNELIKNNYGDDIKDIGIALGYGDLNYQSLFLHNDVENIPMVIRDVYINKNKLYMDIENQSNEDLNLNSYPILRQLPISKYNLSLNYKVYPFVNVLGNDKIVLSGPSFVSKYGSTNYYNSPIFVTNRTGTNYKILNDPRLRDICYNELIPEYINTNTILYITSLTSCVKSSKTDEYFVAFMDYDCCFYLYDSETEKWEKIRGKINGNDLKNETNSNRTGENIRQTGISISNSIEYFYGKKQLDMKDNIVLFTSYRNFIPMIDLSIDGFKTFKNIFDAALNLTGNFKNPNTNVDDNNYIEYDSLKRRYINMPVYCKIINQNTFYSCFGCRILKTDLFSYNGPKNYFLKTTDQGETWENILSEHIEYSEAHTTDRWISEDGNTIEVICVTGPINPYTGYGQYAPNYNEKTLIYNRSTDGGKTWEYSHNNWSIIKTNMYIYNFLPTSFNITQGLDKNNIMLFHNKFENYTIVSFISNPGNRERPTAYITYDNGNNWKSIFQFPYKNSPNNFLINTKFNLNSYSRIENYFETSSNIYPIIPKTTSIPRQGTDTNDFFGISSFINFNIKSGSYQVKGKYTNDGIASSANEPNGKFFEIYDVPLYLRNNVFTFEEQNKDIIDPNNTNKKLKNVEIYSNADYFFDSFKHDYTIFNNDKPILPSRINLDYFYTINDDSVYLTDGIVDILREFEVEYN